MKSNPLAVLILVFVMLALAHPRPLTQASHSDLQNRAGKQGQGGTAQQPENPEQFRAEAEEAIKHLLVSQIEAWNHGDLKGFMDGYWHSPDLTFFSGGTVSRGWNAALQRYQQRYQGTGKQMGKLDFQDLNIDLVGRQAAVVTGSWHLMMPDGKEPHGLFTLILKRMQNGWRIVHDHTSSAE
jgi:ketosteroid isomerase-like protein